MHRKHALQRGGPQSDMEVNHELYGLGLNLTWAQIPILQALPFSSVKGLWAQASLPLSPPWEVTKCAG